MTNAEARFNKSLRPRKPEGSLGRTAQDVHLDSHGVKNQSSVCPCPREGGWGRSQQGGWGGLGGGLGGGGVTLFRDQLGAYYFNCGKSVVPSHKGVKIHIHVACSATTTLAEELAPTYYRVTFHIRIRT